MSFLVIIFVLTSTQSIYNDCSSTINGDANKPTIICDNNCDNCIVNCIGVDSCKQGIIYSGALNTEITCDGISACDELNIDVGNTRNYPNGYREINFYRYEYTSFKINCKSEKSCYNEHVNVMGSFTDGGGIDVTGNGPDRFKGAEVVIYIEPGMLCDLYLYI